MQNSTEVSMYHSLSKSMASGPLKIKKGTCPVLILATWRHTTESVESVLPQWNSNGHYQMHYLPVIWSIRAYALYSVVDESYDVLKLCPPKKLPFQLFYLSLQHPRRNKLFLSNW